MKRILLSLGAITLITSCNTFIGVGRDTQIAGETLEKVAEKASPGTSEYDSGTSSTDPAVGGGDTINPAYDPDDSSVLPVY